MKSAIVYPNFGLDFMRKRGPEGAWINHGIALIISYCNQMNEKVDLIDLRRISTWEEFEEMIGSYDLVGYSILTPDVKNSIKAIEINKKANKNVVISVGGVDPSVSCDKYINNPLIDQVVLGEGEIAFYNLIKAVKNNESIEKVVVGDKIENLDSIDFINRDLWENEPVYQETNLEAPFMTVLSSRACIYNCTFCQPATKKIFGKKERNRTPENFVSELKVLEDKYGMKSFYILDDNALQNRTWLEGFIEEYEKKGIKARFMVSGRSDNIYKNRDLFPKLKKIGLSYVGVGFESGSDKILKYLKKGTTVALNEKAAKVLNNNKIGIIAFMMFGFPIETREDINSSLDFIKKIKPAISGPSTYTPYPGTVLHEKYNEKGLLYSHSSSSLSFPHIPKIKGVNYLYISWIIFRIGYFSSKNASEKLRRIVYYLYASLNIIYLTLKLSLKRNNFHD